jgi:ketosteroid isomerase-like protein
MTHDPVETLRRFHDAVNAQDFPAIEAFFSENAEYGSVKVGALRGKAAIMQAFRIYFAEYPDQVAHDDTFEQLAPNAARSLWHLTATSTKTGAKLVRKGAETIYLDGEGRIERVVVEDE